MIPTIDLERFELVHDRQYVKYYAVNRIECPIAPFGITGKPLTLAQAKKVLRKAIKDDPQGKYQIEEAKVHLSLFRGYQHLSPWVNDDNADQVFGGAR